MTRAIEPALIDTNVLVYAFYHDAEQHLASRALLDRASDPDAKFCTTSQVLAEFYAVVTNPRRVSAPRPPQEALNVIEGLLTLPSLQLLPSPAESVGIWIEFLRHRAVPGAAIFDVQLAATMFANGVRVVYTFDRAGFDAISELTVLTPGPGLEQR